MTRGVIRRVLGAAWVALILVLAAWWRAAAGWPPGPVALAAALAIIPLAIILVPLLRGSRYWAAMSTLLLIPYIGWGLTEAIANPPLRLYAGLTVASGIGCFVIVSLWLRVLRA